MLRKTLFFTALVAALATISLAYGGGSGRHWGHGVSINTNDDSSSDECRAHLEIWSDDRPAEARAEEFKALPNKPLRVTAARNGGIQVKNWDKPEIGVKLCKAAVARTDSAAKEAVERLRLEIANSEVRVTGDRNWDSDDDNNAMSSALIMLFVPKNADLDLNANNGGISLRNVTVTAVAHTTNGGISLKNSFGKITAEAQNGGVSVKDCGGDMSIRVQNGGVHLSLARDWNGKGLEARTHNGGLTVELPDDMRSGVEISAGRWTSIQCDSNACGKAQRNWDDDGRYLHVGTGDTVIRAGTVNGGIVVKRRAYKDAI